MHLLPSSKPAMAIEDLLNLGDESNISEPKDDSPSSGAETPKSKRTPVPGQVLASGELRAQAFAADLIEYEWPASSGKFYFIQEQLAELLSVKSFKRKYPQIRRRQLDVGERLHLKNEHKIDDLMSAHLLNDITVLFADDVHELLVKEYPDFYDVVSSFFRLNFLQFRNIKRYAWVGSNKNLFRDILSM